MKYSIIIPTYNHCNDLLKPCVDSVLTHSRMTDVELIISANGCTDNTWNYLQDLEQRFDAIGMRHHFRYVWNDQPLGYSRANNVAITQASADLVVLLSNDTLLLPQEHNFWLEALSRPFAALPNVGISCVVKHHSLAAAHDYAIFFCVMIHKQVFTKVGLLNEDYEVGGCEDVEFSIETERAGYQVVECSPTSWHADIVGFGGDFPIYHKGQGTVRDESLVQDYESHVHQQNLILLSKKYNPQWYQQHYAKASDEI